MSLIKKLIDKITIRIFPLEKHDEKLLIYTKEARKLLRFKSLPDDIDWTKYDGFMSAINTNLSSYTGRFKDYFNNRLESLHETERLILGYGMHSF